VFFFSYKEEKRGPLFFYAKLLIQFNAELFMNEGSSFRPKSSNNLKTLDWFCNNHILEGFFLSLFICALRKSTRESLSSQAGLFFFFFFLYCSSFQKWMAANKRKEMYFIHLSCCFFFFLLLWLS